MKSTKVIFASLIVTVLSCVWGSVSYARQEWRRGPVVQQAPDREPVKVLIPETGQNWVRQVIIEPVGDFPTGQVHSTGRILTVRLTAYSSTPDQTDSTPFITASGNRVRPGIIAHNGLPFGTKVRFLDIPHHRGKVFTDDDRMNHRYDRHYADLWTYTRQSALKFGAPQTRMEIISIPTR